MEIFRAGKSVEGFVGYDERSVSVAYCFGDEGRELTVTVNDMWQDDFESEDLLKFLEGKNIIASTGNWAVEDIDDTDGSLSEDTFTTIKFVIG